MSLAAWQIVCNENWHKFCKFWNGSLLVPSCEDNIRHVRQEMSANGSDQVLDDEKSLQKSLRELSVSGDESDIKDSSKAAKVR